MIEGDEWKQEMSDEQREAGRMIALDEYTSIIEAFYTHVLGSVTQKREGVDRNVIALTKSELEWKITAQNFEKLPLKIKDAYQTFKELTEALENATDKQIKASKDVLDKLFRLGIHCNVYGMDMQVSHKGRNPCREAQYDALGAIKRAEERGSTPLIEAAKRMAGICLKCPYK